MKKLVISVYLTFMTIMVYGQVKIDTLYYDKNWKGVSSKVFASYFRVMESPDTDNNAKRFKDYYVTGELQGEGWYLNVDKEDDSKSVFDGECINYYKSGAISTKFVVRNGKKNGEFTQYREDGLISLHTYFKDDKIDGVYTEFLKDGDICLQTEYAYGEPLYDYYIISNKDGLHSKVRMADKHPIYDSPTLTEQRTEYKNGIMWSCYDKDGVAIFVNNTQIKDYGRYFCISIMVANNSMYPIDFNPAKVYASFVDKKGRAFDLKVFSSDEYMDRVRRRQNWSMALMAFAEGMAASNAGYSTSTTNTTYSGHSSSYGSRGYRYGNYSGYSTSTTTAYNGAAAYQARVIASNRVAAYNSSLLEDREIKKEGYLRRTTIYPGETIAGYINVERRNGQEMILSINIEGAMYVYYWSIGKE